MAPSLRETPPHVLRRPALTQLLTSTITGIAPTAMEGPAMFDRIELLRIPEVNR